MQTITRQLAFFVAAEPDLKLLSEQPHTLKVAYWMGRLLTAVQAHTMPFHERRTEYVKTIGTRVDDKVETYNIAADKLPEFNKRIAELLTDNVEVKGVLIDMSTLGAATTLSGAGMERLRLAGLLINPDDTDVPNAPETQGEKSICEA